MTLRVGPGSTPHLVRLSTATKAIEVKTSHVAMNALYAGMVNLAHQATRGKPFFEKRTVTNLAGQTEDIHIKSKDLRKIEETTNPVFLKALESYRAPKAAPHPLARDSLRLEFEELPAAPKTAPTPPRTPSPRAGNPRSLQNTPVKAEAPLEEAFFEPINTELPEVESPRSGASTPLESPKEYAFKRVSSQPKALSEPELKSLKEENQKLLDQFADDLGDPSLKNSNIKTVMQALVENDYARSGSSKENTARSKNIERYLETAVYNPKQKRQVSVRQLMTIDQIRSHLKRLQAATPRHMDYHKIAPALQQRIFYETLNEIKTGYNININPDELKSYKTPSQALNHPGLKQLSALLERRSLYPEERELIELFLERFTNTFSAFLHH